MAESFEDLGLRAELVEAARARGWEAPSSLQRASIPVIRRGGNAVLRGSAGAGVLGAYGLALLDRVAGADAATIPLQALVLTPTPEVAAAVANSLASLADAAGVRVHASGPGWPDRFADAAILAATPRAVLDALSASRLKLEGVQTLVLDDAGALFKLGDTQALEAVTDALPRDAQRVVVGDLEGAVADFVERHVRRALTFPPVPADAQAQAQAREGGRVGYMVAENKLDALAGLLERAPVPVVCRTQARAESVARELALRGFAEVTPVTGPAHAPADDPVISYDAPFDADELAGRHAAGGAVIVRAREVAHLRRIAATAGIGLEAVATSPPGGMVRDLEAFRNQLREAIGSGDLAAQLLVLEPLLNEASLAEVAAAACLLARRREVSAPEQAPAQRRSQQAPAAKAPPPGEPFVRLFVSIGQRDDVGPGDILGAITGEAGIEGSRVGRIDIGDTFTTVEVESALARRVIDALNGTTLRNRSLRVDYDRKGPRGGKGGRRPAPRPGPRRRS
ncbi:MAG: DEAD/DEAH box helicase [Gemmatimonadota bacterium]